MEESVGSGDEKSYIGFPCCEANATCLYVVALLIWLVGSLACADRGSALYIEAKSQGASDRDLLITLVVSSILGLIFGGSFFARLANKNIDRLEGLAHPRWYDSFRLRFYLFLVVMDGGFIVLSDYYAQSIEAKLWIGGVCVCICVALGTSALVFVLRFQKFSPMSNKTRGQTDLKTGLLVRQMESGVLQ